MAGSSCSEPGGDEIVGEAVVGSGQYLAFIPCHKQPVRLMEADVQPRNAVACPKDGCRWDVRFVKDGIDWVAVWTPRT
ncbi:MAG: hypothetical protein ACRDZ4_05755 [Egibacteraceae bacterium]